MSKIPYLSVAAVRRANELAELKDELAALKAERDSYKVEYESRAIWIAKMNAILGHDNSDGFHSSPDAFEIAQSLKTEQTELREALQTIESVWSHQSGRVFESMGSDNPRALAIDNAIIKARAVLAKGKP